MAITQMRINIKTAYNYSTLCPASDFIVEFEGEMGGVVIGGCKGVYGGYGRN